MEFELKEYETIDGEQILYTGNVNFQKIELVSKGAGDIWHSSFEQGFKNAFPELVYQTATYFWYLNDFDNLDECVSWRINPFAFAVRKSVWERTGGFDLDFKSPNMQALDFGLRSIRFLGGVPLYIKDLFLEDVKQDVVISQWDRHLFFRKNFKISHAIYMIYRLGFWKISEWKTLLYIKNKYSQRKFSNIIPPRKLVQIKDTPTVSYIIPTMLREDYTLQLLDDLSQQTFKPNQVIIVDGTPEIHKKDVYTLKNYPFEVIVKWQHSKGSCRARNEAIILSTGDYIIFGDDDIRIPPDFISNHIKFLQTNNGDACNGVDITADNHTHNLNDLKIKLEALDHKVQVSGCATWFSNSNSCVKRESVNRLIGNDVNFDGGYGEDGDFGMSLSKIGVTVLANPFSVNLHLKPPGGGYRFWGTQAKIMGKKRKKQPWELDVPVEYVRPVPSPTIMYGMIKHFTPQQLIEFKYKYFSYFLFEGNKLTFLYRLLRLPYKNIQFKKSVFYAKKLKELGVRNK